MKKIILIILITIPLSGICQVETEKKYWSNGNLWYEGNLIDGKEDGVWTYYYQSGQVEQVINYKDGEPLSLKTYCEDGQLLEEGQFNEVTGKRDGRWTHYYDCGLLKMEENFNDGKKEGFTRIYYLSGKLYFEGYFNDGRFGYGKCFDENGDNIKCDERVYN
tara:strand:- start:3365 stop:3850 length:486 start_codon:yes stop_codon:yes gene_type:complete